MFVSLTLKIKKALLRGIARPYLPDLLFKAKKQGFESPMSVMLNDELSEVVEKLLDAERLSYQAIFNASKIEQLVRSHQNEEEANHKILFSLLMFQIWYDEYMGD